MTKDYIERYRAKYPDDNHISDDDLVKTLSYYQFSLNTAAEDFSKSMATALVSEVYKIKNIYNN